MQASGHRKQILFFLITVILPSLVLIIFTLRMIRQEKELAQQRILEERRLLARQIGRNLLVRLETITLQAIGVAADREPWAVSVNFKNREVVLLGLVEGDRLFLPWETDRKIEESLRLLKQSDFREKIRLAERVEFSAGNHTEAARLYDLASSKAGEPVQREYARLLLARALWKAGRKPEALTHYRRILDLPSEVRDEFGLPLAYYAAGSMLEESGDIGRVLERLKVEMQTRSWFSPAETYRLNDLIEELDRSAPKFLDRKAVSDCREAIKEHIHNVEQSLALQRDFRGFRFTVASGGAAPKRQPGNAPVNGSLWSIYGGNPWLVTLMPGPSTPRELLVAVDARVVLTSLKSEKGFSDTYPQDFRLVTDVGAEGESPGENFRGFKIAFVETPEPSVSKGWNLQPFFYQLVLLLVLSTTLYGAYLLWRDIRRELNIAEMRSQFVSSVSHELKTPLTAIRMFAETLRLGRTSNRQMEQEYLDTIVNESERLTRLLNNVLDFSKIEKGRRMYRPVPTAIADILHAAARAMEYPLSQQGFKLDLVIEKGMPEVCVDRDALEQAILNLLHNAMKYSGDARGIELRLRKSVHWALIQVVDRGVGIELREQKRIFEKFYRIPSKENERLPGTGLGLALVDHIVKANGGRVEVESLPGHGSTFSMFLPLEKPQ